MQHDPFLSIQHRSDKGSRPVPPKPPRLRSACTGCRQAKLRCSGEKTGCFRCTKLGLKCEYAISMVGRASKKKHSMARQGRLQNISAHQILPLRDAVFDLNTSDPGLMANPNLLDSVGDQLAYDALLDLPIQTPSTHLDVGGSTGDMLTSMACPEMVPSPSHGSRTASTPSAMDSFSAQPVSLSWLTHPTDCYSSPINLELGCERISQPINHDPHRAHMATLGKCIATLDSHLVQSNDISIDQVLNISKSCVDEVVDLMSQDTYQTCRSCRTLVGSIVDLLLELYEKAPTPDSSPSDDLDTQPKLSLGSFTIDTTEYSSVYNQIIRSELVRLNPIIESLKSGCGAVVGSCKRARHQGLFAEMEWRLQKLISGEGSDSALNST